MVEPKTGKLLDLFVFPSETQLRSILLIWAILGLCWGVGFYCAEVLAQSAGWPAISKLPELDRNILQVEEDSPSTLVSSNNLEAWLKRLGAESQELENPGELARAQADLANLSASAHSRVRAMRPYFVFPLIFLVLNLLCIMSLYIGRVCWLRLSGRAASRTEGWSEFQCTLQALIQEARELDRRRGEGPWPRPRILVSRGAMGDGQAFGSSRWPVILLTRAMPSLLREDIRKHGKPYATRAVALHELAHLANRDITRSYWAAASWIVVLPILMFLMGLPDLGSSAESPGAQVGLQAVAMLFVIELIRRGILRYREHEADLRTALLWNAGDPLRSSLALDVRSSSAPGALRRLSARFWRKHPTAAERRDVLDHPNRTLSLSTDVPFLAGLLFGSLSGSILVLTTVIVLTVDALGVLSTNVIVEKLLRSHGLAVALRLYYPISSVLWGTLMIISASAFLCVASYLLAGTMGAQTQRESVLQLVEPAQNPRPYRSLLKPAVLAAIGFEIGIILPPMTPASLGPGVIPWVLLATLSFWGWLSAIRFFARRLLGTHYASRRPTRQLRITKWISTILLWPLILTLLGGQLWILSPIQLIQAKGALIMVTIGLLGFLCLLALMVFTLAVREVRREERRPQCPHCRSDVLSASAVADCAACGKSLTPWLFIDAPSLLESSLA